MYFIEAVVNQILKETELDKILIIAPNKRTLDIIRHEISKKLGTTIWSPKFTTLSDFIYENSDYQKVDDFVLIIYLYKIFSKLTVDTTYLKDFTLEQFWNIGTIILHDFSEIDNYFVDAQSIFRNILDHEKIDYAPEYIDEDKESILKSFFKKFDLKKFVEQKAFFLELWAIMPLLHKEFSNLLEELKIGYEGFIYKKFTENIEHLKDKYPDYTNFYIVGFNALKKTEQKVFEFLLNNFKTFFAWDYSNYYVNDLVNEAGFFLRKNLKNFPDSLSLDRNKFYDETLNVYQFPDLVSQFKYVNFVLNSLHITEDNKVAIILPTEGYLELLLSSLASNYKKINITIGGYSFKFSILNAFISNWLSILKKLFIEKSVVIDDFNLFLLNSVTISILKSENNDFSKDISFKSSITIDDLEKMRQKSRLFDLLFNFQLIKLPIVFLQRFLEILEYIANNLILNEIEKEFIKRLYTKVLDFQQLFYKYFSDFEGVIDITVFLKIFKNYISSLTIPIIGQATKGIQITTLLETRNLNFDYVIFLGFNEKIIPKTPTNSSFITQYMRKLFDLPIIAYEDSMYAYLFYRLLHNSSKIFIFYSNIPDANYDEKSRFLTQLEIESNIKIQYFEYTDFIKVQLLQPSIILKDDIIIEKLNELFKNNISATLLSTYLACNLYFYYKYLGKIPPKKDFFPTYEISAIEIGQILHEVMFEYYKDYVNMSITDKILSLNTEKIEELVNKYFSKFTNYDQIQGFNILIRDVIVKFVNTIIELDQKLENFKILSLETFYYTALGNSNYKLEARFDRLDNVNGVIRIVDYKTGKVEIPKISSLDDFFENFKMSYKVLFQMFFYAYVFRKRDKTKGLPSIALYNLVEQKIVNIYLDKIFMPLLGENYEDEFIEKFEKILLKIIEQILNKNIPFNLPNDKSQCKNCDFYDICYK